MPMITRSAARKAMDVDEAGYNHHTSLSDTGEGLHIRFNYGNDNCVPNPIHSMRQPPHQTGLSNSSSYSSHNGSANSLFDGSLSSISESSDDEMSSDSNSSFNSASSGSISSVSSGGPATPADMSFDVYHNVGYTAPPGSAFEPFTPINNTNLNDSPRPLRRGNAQHWARNAEGRFALVTEGSNFQRPAVPDDYEMKEMQRADEIYQREMAKMKYEAARVNAAIEVQRQIEEMQRDMDLDGAMMFSIVRQAHTPPVASMSQPQQQQHQQQQHNQQQHNQQQQQHNQFQQQPQPIHREPTQIVNFGAQQRQNAYSQQWVSQPTNNSFQSHATDVL
ncbi:hypothetical protein B0H34DRAFT_798409 [Crassisporium funariophilum]|nr:hypothetical protein B0H34DRAFT_798409 [Crassisporium funariophilum]